MRLNGRDACFNIEINLFTKKLSDNETRHSLMVDEQRMMDRKADGRKRPRSKCRQTLSGNFLVGSERKYEVLSENPLCRQGFKPGTL